MKIYATTFLIALLLFSAKEGLPQNHSAEYSPPLSYPFREISNPIIKDNRFEKIIILSGPRVGSTLAFMIFQYLFEDTLGDHESFDNKVVKTHFISDDRLPLLCHPNTYIVVPTRNPIDSFCSLVKVLQLFTPEEAISLLKSEILRYQGLKDTLSLLDKNRVLAFKYEEFNENFFKIFEELENKFQIEISDYEKEKINMLFSKNSVRNYFKDFHSFSERNPVIGIHGHHISSDKRTLDDIFPKEIIEEIHRQLAPIASLLGY